MGFETIIIELLAKYGVRAVNELLGKRTGGTLLGEDDIVIVGDVVGIAFEGLKALISLIFGAGQQSIKMDGICIAGGAKCGFDAYPLCYQEIAYKHIGKELKCMKLDDLVNCKHRKEGVSNDGQ